MSTLEYYQKSLAELRERAAEFARANPALAPHLSGPSPDPDVERVLEGVAYLTGQIHERLDDDFPQFAQGLVDLIFPHYLRPIPSASIIEFQPKAILKNTLQVPAGTYVDSTEVEGVHCRFRTCYDIDVDPLFINQVNITDRGGGRRGVQLSMELRGLPPNQWQSQRLRLFVGGDYAGAVDTYRALCTQLDSIEITSGGDSLPVVLPPDVVQPWGFAAEQALLPYPNNAFPVYRMLQEYFLLKEKFLFLEIAGLDRWRERTSANFELTFVFKPLPNMPRINAERFMLHATPAVNLFEQDAEPITVDQRRSDLPLRAGRGGTVYPVHSVLQVVGHARRAGQKREYLPIGLFEPGGSRQPVYQYGVREEQPVVTLSTPPAEGNGEADTEAETLTVSLLCTNGNLPAGLRPGDINRRTASASELVDFRNVTPPTPYQPAPTGRDTLWRLLSHLSLNYMSLANTDNLKALLGLYLFADSGDRKAETANRRRIDSITEVHVTAADRLVQGVVMRGHDVVVAAARDHFASDGDLYLFGAVLEELFASMAALNSYTAFTLRDSNSGEEYEWPAKLGNRPLI